MTAVRDPFLRFMRRLDIPQSALMPGLDAPEPPVTRPVIGLGAAAILGGLLFIVSLFPAPAPSLAKRASPASAATRTDPAAAQSPPQIAPPQTPIDTDARAPAIDVAFYTPQAPLTVTEATRLRSAPSADSRALGTLLPGVRLRVNGRVDDAPDGPWLRHRLNSGGVGYVAENMTSDLGVWQRRRNAERAEQKGATSATPPESGAQGGGEGVPAAPPAEQPATPF